MMQRASLRLRRWHLLVIAVLLVASYVFIEGRYVAERRELVLQQDDIAQALTRAYLDDHGPIFTHDGALYAGRYRINWSDTLVDAVKAESGCGATIFQGDERIATTALEPGTSDRAIGTRADPEIKARVLEQGHTYRGVHDALGRRWLIVYSPLKDAEEKTVGMLATYREQDALDRELLYFRLLLGGTFAALFAVVIVVVRWAESQQRAVQRARRKMVEDRAKAQAVFFESMTHELRTPLSAIIVFAESLHERFQEDAASTTVADRIRAEAKDVLRVVEDILDFSKIEAGKVQLKVEEVDLKVTIAKAVERAGELVVASGVRVKADVPGDLPAVNADPARLEQVVTYLLANAIQSMNDGSVVLAARVERDAVTVHVTDGGGGLGAEQLATIWDPFRQAAPATRAKVGSGLALAIVRGLVTAMGGDASVASTPGKGSTFTVRFPRAQVTA
jgi:signal transduction histidine kinase